MTENLHAKFTTLESLITADHTELMAALNSIAYALGAPPTAPTITLADVVTALTQTNVILAGIRSDQAAQSTALLSTLNSIYLNSETLINNNSTNAQLMLKAIYATFCACTTTTPLLAPPLIVSPTPLLTDEKCKRIQFYLSVFTNWLAKIGNYTATASFITGDVVGTLLGLAATEAGLVATTAEASSIFGPPGVVVGAAVGLIMGAVYLLGSAVINTYLIEFSAPVFQHTLLEALYAANSADEGETAFENVVGAEFGAVPSGILSALWWSAWSNEMYSATPVVDDSAFDGTICAPPDSGIVMIVPTVGCHSAQSVLATMGDGTTLQVIDWAGGSTSNFIDSSLTQTSDKRVWGLTDLFGLWVSSVPDCHAYLDAAGFPNFGIGATLQQITVHTNNRYAFLTASTPFVLTICVTGP